MSTPGATQIADEHETPPAGGVPISAFLLGVIVATLALGTSVRIVQSDGSQDSRKYATAPIRPFQALDDSDVAPTAPTTTTLWVATGPIAVGEVVPDEVTRNSAAARPGDLVIALPVDPQSPTRELIDAGMRVELLVTRAPEDTTATSGVFKNVLVLRMSDTGIVVGVPDEYVEELADLGLERLVIAVPAR